jgi:hypothetical protein
VSGVLLTAAPCAYAGRWALASCVNPGGSAAPSEGWSSSSGGGTGYGSNNSTSCAPGAAMFAELSTDAASPVGAYEQLRYTPPGDSTLIGGTISVSFRADGYGYDASGVAAVYTPEFAYDGANVFFQCASGLTPCFAGTNDYTGGLELPAGRGGSLYLAASCGGEPGASCDAGGSEGAWSLVRLYSAELLLENNATPTASGFAGSLLEGDAHGTASLQFTASDPDGPGVYAVAVQIEGQDVYEATPNGNDGHCAPAGSYGGALVFDYQQPCKESETIDIPVDTASLPDGQHTLTVSVTDAAGNTSVVYSGTIATANRTSVSALLDSPPDASGIAAARYAIELSKRTARLAKHLKRSYAASAVRLSGRLVDSAGTPAPGVTVWLTARNGSKGARAMRVLAHASTNADGRWSLRAPKGPSRQLRIVYGASARSASASESLAISETVRPSISLHVASPGSGRIVFSGRLRIRPLGSPRPLVTIQTRAPGGWEAVGLPVRIARNGDYLYAFTSSPLTIGRSFAFRATTPATGLWRAASSPVREAVVR